MTVLAPRDCLTSKLLGDEYPYWWRADDGVIHWFRHPEDAVSAMPVEHRTVDPVAVLSLLSFQYVCLDRTMVQGIERLPWLGTIWGTGELEFSPAPPHGMRRIPMEDIAKGLLKKLEGEILRYAEGREVVYVLLSGGMDSRVMAAVIARLQQRGELKAEVETVTWGRPGTRDVVYAERLSNYHGWAWHWAELDDASYWANFEFGAVALGAEVDPKHLHRMDWFRHARSNSVVLAASYGDSVGRAEFSSLHLSNVPPLTPSDRNRLLRPTVREWAWTRLERDLCALRERHGPRSELGWREVERQAHYMRRMLCHTMCTINRWTRVEQVFVAPEVFGFMWGLDPVLRTNEIYMHMLRELDPLLLELAWARTGARYDTGGGSDTLERDFHRYGLWLRTNHAEDIGELLFGDRTIDRLRLFDMDQLRWMYEDWRRERPADNTSLCTELSSVAALSEFARRFDLSPPQLEHPSPPMLRPRLKGHASKYQARASQKLRRLSRPLRMRIK